ncbi:hypothetical protein [Robertkochia solimangrovi]|uniref:hypothetical protein n=1 Tax=Robertkochia solimangrovi TaxID=2213046 RepID=UPI0011810BDB|nr:hypothetical protein [Robertkochia solimangrovi]TRZ45306.1 hypothetical protein DMZ48_06050 [Robertkochia solimangrovi]
MKRFLKISAFILLGLVVLSGILFLIYNEPLPDGTPGPEAEAMAQKMLRTLNNTNFQKTKTIEWQVFEHHYSWNKADNKASVKWKDNEVILDLTNYSESVVFVDGIKKHTEPREELIKTAVEYYNNDSFWLVAPFKIYDPGTIRGIVNTDDGKKGLLVTYTTGGSTPGDSYLWFLNEDGFPTNFKMWVSIIPLGGVNATWEDWKFTESGIYLPQKHKLSFFDFSISNIDTN